MFHPLIVGFLELADRIICDKLLQIGLKGKEGRRGDATWTANIRLARFHIFGYILALLRRLLSSRGRRSGPRNAVRFQIFLYAYS
ncbi:MAG TPA: hypothetical protein DEP53_06025 [Bacteroidetes bacterium]|nr:hypothetical protein [Bacteroidota bacterium]